MSRPAEDGRIAPAATALTRGHPRGAAGRDRQLERAKLVERRIDGAARIGCGDRRVAKSDGVEGDVEMMDPDERLVGQSARDRHVVSDPHRWQQVRLDRTPDELVPQREAVVVLTDEAVFDRLVEPVVEVGVEDAVPTTRRVRRARRPAGEPALNSSAMAASPARPNGRPAGAIRRRARRASGDRAPMRASTRSWKDDVSEDTGELAARGQQLLGDERATAGSLRDDDEDAALTVVPPRSLRSAGRAHRA